jgi:hypothetical protein
MRRPLKQQVTGISYLTATVTATTLTGRGRRYMSAVIGTATTSLTWASATPEKRATEQAISPVQGSSTKPRSLGSRFPVTVPGEAQFVSGEGAGTVLEREADQTAVRPSPVGDRASQYSGAWHARVSYLSKTSTIMVRAIATITAMIVIRTECVLT